MAAGDGGHPGERILEAITDAGALALAGAVLRRAFRDAQRDGAARAWLLGEGADWAAEALGVERAEWLDRAYQHLARPVGQPAQRKRKRAA